MAVFDGFPATSNHKSIGHLIVFLISQTNTEEEEEEEREIQHGNNYLREMTTI